MGKVTVLRRVLQRMAAFAVTTGMVLSFATIPVSASSVALPTNISLNNNNGRYVVSFTPVSNEGIVIFELYHNDKLIHDWATDMSYFNGRNQDLNEYINESGRYHVVIKVANSIEGYMNQNYVAVSPKSNEISITLPEQRISAPTVREWSPENPNIAKWDHIDGANMYIFNLYVNGMNVGGYSPPVDILKSIHPTEGRADFTLEVEENGGLGKQYGLTCQTISNNLNVLRNSEIIKIGYVPDSEVVGGIEEPSNGMFEDVQDMSSYYYEPVYWAHEKGITGGTSPTTFSPEMTCTRAQIVTFLWRAVGSPAASGTGSTFSDVIDSSQWYYQPVLWARDNAITSGVGGGLFGCEQPCTRAQVVTFLWRSKGSPEPSSTASGFSDVSDPSAYYYKAVLWAVENNITSGVGDGLFGVERPCTRGQVVTFLYRTLN